MQNYIFISLERYGGRWVFSCGRAGSDVADMEEWMAGLELKKLDCYYNVHSQVPDRTLTYLRVLINNRILFIF